MMKIFLILTFAVLIIEPKELKSQEKKSHFSISANFGVNGNFFVQSYRAEDPPQAAYRLYEKDFLGATGGIEIKYALSRKGSLLAGYARSVNSREGSFQGTRNGVNVWIWDFTVQHRQNYFYLAYERQLLKKLPGFRVQVALAYIRPQQQEIEIINNDVNIWERKQKNAKLNDVGAFIGFNRSWKIDTHFTFGIQVRYYQNLTSWMAEEITLTPALTYHFYSKKARESYSN
jgi:hypothetical protein